uniref:Uncharacterized protein n=1 Tax=Sphaerodactylus townsendi TaxID=933632 RepID=A0ACB8EN06_9SAUR
MILLCWPFTPQAGTVPRPLFSDKGDSQVDEAKMLGPPIQPNTQESLQLRTEVRQRRACRVGLLADIGQKLLEHCEREEQLRIQEAQASQEARVALLEQLRIQNQQIADGVKAVASAITMVAELIAQRVTSQQSQPQVAAAICTCSSDLPQGQDTPAPREQSQPKKRARKEKHIFDL